MPSLATRVAIARHRIGEVTAAAEAVTAIAEDIQDGTLDLEAVTVGGTRFINDGGTLVAEP